MIDYKLLEEDFQSKIKYRRLFERFQMSDLTAKHAKTLVQKIAKVLQQAS